jgi:hypothetical protein
MISRDLAEFREFQRRMTPVGKIRIGIYATPEGRRGRPEKINTFRFTADNEALIRAVAEEYGGTAEQWTPQGSRTAQWQVITDAKAVEVYVVNGQRVDPVYEAWAGGRTCVRRCDGEWEQIKQEACLCNGPARPADTRELCKITLRVQVMLQRIQGLGSWLLETHGENAVVEMSMFDTFIAAAPMPVPAMLRLREETRRVWNFEKKKFDTLSFFVPWFDISAINARQIAIGGDALTQALSAAGAPAAISGASQYAIEARPVSAPVVPAVPTSDAARPEVTDELRAKILADIEGRTTVEDLNTLRDKLIARGINDSALKDAWASKRNAVQAADDLRERARQLNAADHHILNDAVAALPEAERAALETVLHDRMTATPRPYRVLVTGSRTWADAERIDEQLSIALMTHRGRMVVVNGMCEDGADRLAFEWAERNGVPTEKHPAKWADGKGAGFARNLEMVESRPDIVLSFNRGGSNGTEHCTAAAEKAGLKVLRFTDDTPIEREAPRRYAPFPGSTIVDIGRTDLRAEAGALAVNPDDRAALNEVRADLGMEPLPPVGEREYQVGDTVTVGGIEFTKISDNPFPPGTPAADLFATGELSILGDPVDAVALPDVPDDDYDADDLYAMLMNGASRQTPPLTTSELNALITRACGADHLSQVDGRSLARLRAGLKAGTVSWR